MEQSGSVIIDIIPIIVIFAPIIAVSGPKIKALFEKTERVRKR